MHSCQNELSIRIVRLGYTKADLQMESVENDNSDKFRETIQVSN